MARYVKGPNGTESKLVPLLIRKFPDAITRYYNSMELDFVTTVDRFAQRIMEKLTENERHWLLGRNLNSQEEVAKYLATYLHDLSESCQSFLDEHCYKKDGEIYSWDYDEDEETTPDDYYYDMTKEDYEF